MKKIGFVIWLCFVAPCLAQDTVVLRQGGVSADKLWVGAFADVVYLGTRGEQLRVNGYIKDIRRNTFIIGTGLKKEQISFAKVLVIALGDNRRVVERQRMMLNGLSEKSEVRINTPIVAGQLLLGGVLGVGGSFAGALVGMGIDSGRNGQAFGNLAGFLLGGTAGLILGSALGVSLVGNGSFEKPLWGRALIGSLIGFGVGVAVTSESGLWPTLFIAPPVFATTLSWVGNTPKNKPMTVNVGFMRNGGQGVSAAYHF